MTQAIERELKVGEFRGYITANGYVFGFDYASQCWIDNRPLCHRDTSYSRGSASNPISELPRAIAIARAVSLQRPRA